MERKRLILNVKCTNHGRGICDIVSLMGDKNIQFLKVYSNLPSAAREEIVVVVDDEPMSWKAARLEVEMQTPMGKTILDILSKLKILL